MAGCQEASDMVKSDPLLEPDDVIVDYARKDERDASEYQIIWSNAVDKGPLKSSSTYRGVDVLLLCWKENSKDMTTEKEVHELESVFVDNFGYHAQIQYLDAHKEQKLQVQVNAIIAKFVHDHDGPNKLLIVYYAGHGRPGEFYGSLELFGYFEYLAATGPMHGTPVPGKDSFTSALVYALTALREGKDGGRFTTVELLNKIRSGAPSFSREQTPVLSDRINQDPAGRIMLHPVTSGGSISASRRKDIPSPNLDKRHTLTLYFDFGNKPTKEEFEKFSSELNGIFERFTFGVHRVRWGGMGSAYVKAAKMVSRCFSRSRRSGTVRAGDSNSPGRTDLDFDPSTSDHLPQPVGIEYGSHQLGSPDSEPITLSISGDSNGEATDQE
ncbi:hypothetical protein MMC26_006509 [Xylographa opegraphella]|nr:hypothetical protein [Xylographa opegraphella]